MDGIAMGATIIFLMGCLIIVYRAASRMNRKIKALEAFIDLILDFSLENSEKSTKEYMKDLDTFLKKHDSDFRVAKMGE